MKDDQLVVDRGQGVFRVVGEGRCGKVVVAGGKGGSRFRFFVEPEPGSGGAPSTRRRASFMSLIDPKRNLACVPSMLHS